MDRSVLASLIVLPPLYAAALLLPLFPIDSYGLWAGASLTIAVGVISVSSNKVVQEISAMLLIVLAFLALGGLAGAGAFGGFGIQVADGALIGLPFVVSAYVWRYGEPIRNRVIAFQATLLFTLMLLATRTALLDANIAVTGTSFVNGFVNVNLDQIQALGALVQGLPYPGLPLSEVSDPVFLVTSVVAFAGLLLVVIRPQTGREADLPTSTLELPEPYRPPGVAVRMLSFSQYELLQARSRPTGPPTRWLPGAVPLVLAAVAVGAGLVLAFVLPEGFLLTSALVVVAVLFGMGYVLSGSRRGILTAPAPDLPPAGGSPGTPTTDTLVPP